MKYLGHNSCVRSLLSQSQHILWCNSCFSILFFKNGPQWSWWILAAQCKSDLKMRKVLHIGFECTNKYSWLRNLQLNPCNEACCAKSRSQHTSKMWEPYDLILDWCLFEIVMLFWWVLIWFAFSSVWQLVISWSCQLRIFHQL